MGLNCISFVINPFRPAEGTRIPDFGIGRHEVITIAAALFKDDRPRPGLRIRSIPKSRRRTGVGGRLLRVRRLISIIWVAPCLEAVAADLASGLDNWMGGRCSSAMVVAGSAFGSLVEGRFWVGCPTGPGRLAAVGPAGQSRGAGADL